MFDKRIINGKVYLDNEFKEVNLYLEGELIVGINQELFEAKETLDAMGNLVLPGLIDPHVHFDLDLGHIRSKDDFYHGTKAAAYGGVTTIIDFLEPVDNPDELQKAYNARLLEAEDSVIDYFFHATIKNPKCDLEDFVKKMKELNIHSLKLFTTYSDSNRRTYDKDIIELLKLSEKYKFLLLAHIENDDLIDLDPKFTYHDLLKSRPTKAETKEALKLASYVKKFGGYLYMVHLSSGTTLKALKEKYSDILNKRFFIESCPHYFTFTNDCLELNEGNLYTLAPPLRTIEEKELLINNFSDVYTIGTDHCAFMTEDKQAEFLKDIPLGIGGVEFSFDVMFQLFGKDTIPKMSRHISSLYPNLGKHGKIKTGNLANIFIYELSENNIKTHHGFTDYTIYKYLKRKGKVIHTLNRGKFIIKSGEFVKPNSKKI
ncbi:MAG: amidohydrolase family protein [Candidatus Izimaplasma sp.]|nr:amidohydrolase family protein [Candidatus Izimaplasma bacterium]